MFGPPRRFITATFTLLLLYFAAIPVNAGEYLVFRGGAISNERIAALVAVPHCELINAHSIYFACSAILYQDQQRLVYENSTRSCQVFEDFVVSTSANVDQVDLGDAGGMGSLDLLSNNLLGNGYEEVLFFDSLAGRVSRVEDANCARNTGAGTTSPPPPPPPPPTDTDGDGRPDSTDNCPTTPNAGQEDVDGDGIGDLCDNCSARPNADQRDTNADGYGNICDADLNNDQFVNVLDLGLFKQLFFSADADSDFNGDGVVNVLDLGEMKLMFFQPPGPSGLAP